MLFKTDQNTVIFLPLGSTRAHNATVRGDLRISDKAWALGKTRYNLPPAEIQRLVAGFIAGVSGG